MPGGAGDQNRASEPFDAPRISTHDAKELLRKLLKDCGAILPKRDAVDARVVEQIRWGKGSLINSQREVGGWPRL